MQRLQNFLRLSALLSVFLVVAFGCETIKGTANGAYRGAQRDVEQVVLAAKGETEEPKGLGIAVDKVMKVDRWIKKNMW